MLVEPRLQHSEELNGQHRCLSNLSGASLEVADDDVGDVAVGYVRRLHLEQSANMRHCVDNSLRHRVATPCLDLAARYLKIPAVVKGQKGVSGWFVRCHVIQVWRRCLVPLTVLGENASHRYSSKVPLSISSTPAHSLECSPAPCMISTRSLFSLTRLWLSLLREVSHSPSLMTVPTDVPGGKPRTQSGTGGGHDKALLTGAHWLVRLRFGRCEDVSANVSWYTPRWLRARRL